MDHLSEFMQLTSVTSARTYNRSCYGRFMQPGPETQKCAKTFVHDCSYNFGCKKNALSDFLASSSSWKIANTGKPAYNINLQGCYAEAYMTQDFQRHFNLNTCLREWKIMLSL